MTWVVKAAAIPRVHDPANNPHVVDMFVVLPRTVACVVVCERWGWAMRVSEVMTTDVEFIERLPIPDNISVLRLPPYAPELNPIENVWEYLRGNKLSMIVWNSYDAITEACRDAWNWLMSEPIRIRSITTRPWASVRN